MNIQEIISKISIQDSPASSGLTQEQHDAKTESIIIAFCKIFQQVYLKDFVVDSDNEKQFKKLAYYFSENPIFESLGKNYKLNKGLFLSGDYGCGKSSMIHCFGEVLRSVRSGFITYSFLDIDDDFVLNGYNVFINHRKPFAKYYDDFGQENMIVGNYANKESVGVKIAEFRYRLWIEQKVKTHYSTNMNGDNFKVRYTDFIYSRIKESCNIIIFSTGTKNRRL